MKKAFEVSVAGTTGIIAAETAGKAKYQAFLDADDCGIYVDGRRVKITDVSAKRAPQFDGWASVQTRRRYLSQWAVEKEITYKLPIMNKPDF